MVQRRSSSGRLIGANERVDPVTALRSLTVDTAWIAGDEDTRGSLAPGRYADLVRPALALLSRTEPEVLEGAWCAP